MALSDADLIAAGYHKNEYGNWQRGTINSDDTVFRVEGAFSELTSGSTASILNSTIADWRSGSSFPVPQTPRQQRDFHFQELSIQMGEVLQQEKKALDKLMNEQNKRAKIERTYYAVNTKLPIDYARAQLNLQQSMLNEMKANVGALEARHLVIEVDKVYHSAKIWWPTSSAEAKKWQAYVDKKQQEMDKIQQEISSYQSLINELTKNIAQTNKDIQSINNGLVPGKYKNVSELQLILNALKTVSDFYKNVTQQFGTIAGNNATKFAYASKGKKIRNSKQAIAAWNKYQRNIYTKFKAADIKAIENSMKSVKSADLAKKLASFQRGLGVASYAINAYLLVNEIQTSAKTGNWNNTLLKIETLLAGMLAGEVLALMFSFMALTPLTAAAFVILMAIAAVYIDDELMEGLNHSIDSLK